MKQEIKLPPKLKKELLPKHIGFILDGNGRWATKRKLARIVGHQKGLDNLENIIKACFDFGLECVSVFAFSTENWKRPQKEIDAIFNLLRDFIKKQNEICEDKQKQILDEYQVKLHTMGDTTKLPKDLSDAIVDAKKRTQKYSKRIFNIAINYGGRDDIINACNTLLKKGKKQITEQDFVKCLYSDGLPELDYIVRTGGDLRLSNFMLYQGAYSELYFTPKYWPDFSKRELTKALLDYQKRNRKFGGVSE